MTAEDGRDAPSARLNAADVLEPLFDGGDVPDDNSSLAQNLAEAHSNGQTGAFRALRWGQEQAKASLTAAADAFDALDLTLGRSVSVPSALLRMILENASTASWLVDRQASSAEKVMRSEDLRYRDWQDTLDFFESAANDRESPSAHRGLSAARSLMEEHRSSGRSHRDVPGYLRPARTQFGAEAMYRLIAGHTHGRPWARDLAMNTWASAFGGNDDDLHGEILGTLLRAANWLCWGALDYAEYVHPSRVVRVEEVRIHWGALPRPNGSR